MARRQKSDDIVGGIIFAILALIALICFVALVAAVYLAPIVLIVGTAISGFRVGETPRDFSYTTDEIASLLKLKKQLHSIETRLRKIEQEGASLWKNLDDSYDRRSKKGRALNDRLERLTEDQEVCEVNFNETRQRPFDALDLWKRILCLRDSFIWIDAIYLGLVATFYYLNPEWIEAWSRTIKAAVPILFPAMPDTLYGAGSASAFASAALFPIVYYIRKGSLNDSIEPLMDSLLEQCPEAFEEEVYESDDSDEPTADAESQNEGIASKEDEAPWYAVLGISPHASDQEINIAWKEQVKKCHPDLVSQLDPDFRVLAELKVKALNAARDRGLRKR